MHFMKCNLFASVRPELRSAVFAVKKKLSILSVVLLPNVLNSALNASTHVLQSFFSTYRNRLLMGLDLQQEMLADCARSFLSFLE